jgi:hypothetical protein
MRAIQHHQHGVTGRLWQQPPRVPPRAKLDPAIQRPRLPWISNTVSAVVAAVNHALKYQADNQYFHIS